MADDQRDTAGRRESRAEGGPEQGPADTAEWQGLSEEDRERLAETVEERVGREQGREEEARGRLFSKDQIIHEAAIMARGMYGSTRPSLKMETYGEKQKEAGYYDLVDCWAVVSHRLDRKYHEEFLKRATPFQWKERTNRYLIPNYYVFGMKGVDRAINERYISPLFSDKLKYRLTVHFSIPFIVAGPPLAYFDWVPFGPTEQEAISLAQLEEEGEPVAVKEQREDLEYYKRRVHELGEDVERLEDKIDEMQRKKQGLEEELEEMDKWGSGENEEKIEELETGIEELEDRIDASKNELEEKMEEFEAAYSNYNELKEQTPLETEEE